MIIVKKVFGELGSAVFTLREAARYSGENPANVRNWMRKKPLWRPDFAANDTIEMSFRDLASLRVVRGLREAGVSLQAIRKAIPRAADILASERPLSSARFRTDGRAVFLEVAREDGDTELLELLSGQLAFGKILDPFLLRFDFRDDQPERWWIAGKRSRIVIEAKRGFGQPIDHESGVPARTLVEAVDAEGSVRAAARSYNVSEKAVRDAVKVERLLAA